MPLDYMLERKIQVSSLDGHGSRGGVAEVMECGTRGKGQPKKLEGPLMRMENK